MTGKVILIPTVLADEDQALATIPPYVIDGIRQCQVFFAENEKTARRFFKKVWKEMVIDDYKWYTIHKAEDEVKEAFSHHLKNGQTIGIVSEAGCPGVADPGQLLVERAQQHGAVIHPLVGPSSILLALMASGMNGQCFQFIGYLPIDSAARKKSLKDLDTDIQKKNGTQIFIETPYRNNQLVKDILSTCRNEVRLCIAVDITASTQSIITKTIQQWKQHPLPELHKRPAIFLLGR